MVRESEDLAKNADEGSDQMRLRFNSDGVFAEKEHKTRDNKDKIDEDDELIIKMTLEENKY